MDTRKIDIALAEHMEGLIGGDNLIHSEIAWWIELLQMAADHKTPVKRAKFLGFSFIRRTSDIPEAINYLAYHAG